MKPFRFSGKNRTFLTSLVAHRDHEIELLPFEFRQRLRSLRGDVDAKIQHHGYCLHAHLRRVRPSRRNLKHVTRLVPSQRLSHLAPGRVSRTDYEHPSLLHNRPLRHKVYLAVATRSWKNALTRSWI